MHSSVLLEYPAYNIAELNDLYAQAMKSFHHKIVVLDDDPTGIQKVHGVHVYTNWEEESILDGFQSEQQMFFILTNSRAFSKEKTKQVHQEITERVIKAAKQTDTPFIIISRGDSTLRGHFPLETATIHDTLNHTADGELIIPFFKEGGRYTLNNIHFVESNGELIPAGETEFAKDRTFGYTSSHLGEYVEEKSNGAFLKENVTYITLEDLRSLHIEKITEQLINVTDFNKVVVNAISDDDLKVLSIALVAALNNGKQFLFRTAASFTKVIGRVPDKELLSKEEMIEAGSNAGGLIIVGSHVNKTTQQLNELLKLDFVEPIEFNSDLVLHAELFEKEIQACIQKLDENIQNGQTSVIYTKRKRLDLGAGMAEKELELSVKISDGLTRTIQSLSSKPKYIIAKGGITSSEIGTTALGVKKALVLGQALPGIPVWKTDENSKYPNMPYVIFPGNVGNVTDLYTIVKNLE
ncbi:hydroxyacid dehydrogenase [Caldibacillus lycopersici]|uniref:Hydroxyacid dehydrogenase n=1 Tax=Perspicuibacillus lycopersici TaxID=1325689 RepID=A0AAE3LQ38_9BACI|nr:four-carbon acid sugar kinase family protein [Perspicuibacillus lycopersici]MCU9613014.1 hydroxyacid dehydrogenase [Perspicuibacillus lycopersici]